MVVGKFLTSLEEARKLLSELGMLEDFQKHPTVPRDFIRICRTMENYKDLWTYLQKNRIYSFLLPDQSIILLNNASDLTYSYYDCPYEVISFDEYYHSIMESAPEEGDKEAYKEEYLEHIDTEMAERHVTPIRYDFSPNAYRPAAHPSSHLHVGHESNYRIGCERVLTPLAFVKFVIRQAFPNEWEKYLGGLDNAALKRVESRIRSGLDPVEGFRSKLIDKCEMSLL